METDAVAGLRRRVEQLKGLRNRVQKDSEAARTSLREAKHSSRRTEKALVIMQEAAQMTQKELEWQISELCSLAMESVFADPYRVELEFVQKRNRTEAEIWFRKGGGERLRPLDASGGGPADVAAFALRVALWSMRRPRRHPVLFLDEPFRFLSRDLLPAAGEMVKEISQRLGLQIVMITHSPILAETADRTFKVSQRKGVSEVSVEG